jgi:hypothetical protein
MFATSASLALIKARQDYDDPTYRTPAERDLIKQADIRYGQKTITENIEYIKSYLKGTQTKYSMRMILYHTLKLF